MNFFMMLDFSDPADQLAWLVQQLQLSEEEGEVSDMSSCLPGWLIIMILMKLEA